MDTKMTTPDAAALAAAAWISEVERTKWRLMALRSRGQSDHSGPTFIRRFIVGAPSGGQLRAIVESYKNSEPLRSVWVDGREYPGPWRILTTIWSRDFLNKENPDRGDATLTLMQDLLLAGEEDSYGFGASLSCSEIADVRYVWAATAVEGLPETSDPGYSYQIAGVRRDDTTGLFDYYVMRVFKKAQELSYESNETVFERVTRRQRQSMQPEDFSPTAAGTPEPGTTIDVDARKNPDCTIDETQTTTVAKTVEAAAMSSRDVYKGTESTRTVAVSAPLGHAPEPSGGVIVQNSSQIRKDGKFDVEAQVTTERQVSEAQTSRGVAVKFVTEERLDISGTPADLPSDLAIGETVAIEKTPGGIFRNTLRKIRVRLAGLKLGLLFSEDSMKKSLEITAVESEEPLDPGFSGGGLVKTARATLNEAGAWDVTRQSVQEKSVPRMRETVAVNPRAVVSELQAVAPVPASAPGDAEIGRSVTNTLTPGSFWETVSRTVRLVFGRLAEGVSETRFRKQTEVSETAAASAGISRAFSAGQVVSVSSQKNDLGGWDVRTTVDLAKKADGVTNVRLASTPFMDTVQTRVVNDTTVPVIPEYAAPSTHLEQLQAVQENEYSRFDHVKTVQIAKPHIETFEATIHTTYTKLIKFRNYTKDAANALLASTTADRKVLFVSTSSDFDITDFGLVNGQIVLTGLDTTAGDPDWLVTPFTEIVSEVESTDRNGLRWLTTTTESGIFKTGSNYQWGLTDYVSGAVPRAGSSFSRMGAYGYSYRKVIDITIVKERIIE